MHFNLTDFVLALIPLFVAFDAIGNIPLFLSLVEGQTQKERRKTVRDTIITALVVAFLFVVVGQWVLDLLNITIHDFQIAGGLLLFIIAVRLLLPGAHKKPIPLEDGKDIGVFPLGTPLVTGPAVLTTSLILLKKFGFLIVFASIAVNIAAVWLSFRYADKVVAVIGVNGSRAFAKIMYILLAAIGVMMVRHGIMAFFTPA